MVKPEELELISLLNLKKSNVDWCVFRSWLDKCLCRYRKSLSDSDDTNSMIRYQGCVRATRFIIEQLDESRENYDNIRKNTA